MLINGSIQKSRCIRTAAKLYAEWSLQQGHCILHHVHEVHTKVHMLQRRYCIVLVPRVIKPPIE